MKILFDHQTFNYQNFGGISRYFTEVINGLKKVHKADVDLQLIYSHNEHLAEKGLHPTKPYFKSVKGGWRIQNLLSSLNKLLVKRKLSKGVDIFHPTYFDTYFLDSLGKAKFVFTIYDMIHEKKLIVAKRTPALLEIIDNKRSLASRADKVIAISESTKKDIIEFYGIADEKVDVIYLSSSLQPIKNYQPLITLPEKYILFVGNRKEYKNFIFFIRSITPLLALIKDLHVICAGGGKFAADELIILDELEINDKVTQVNFDDALLAYLYQNAVCFVFPSLYEGFGIPTLEAFSCGCPVVLSNTSSMPEVGGDAVIYIDPENQESIYNGVKQLVESEALQQTLKEKGYLQAKKFSWSKCVEEHYQLYNSLVR